MFYMINCLNYTIICVFPSTKHGLSIFLGHWKNIISSWSQIVVAVPDEIPRKRWSLKYRQSILAVYFTTNSAIVQDSFHMLRKIMSHRFLLVHAEPLSDPSRDNFLRENTELTFRHVAGFNVRTTWITFRYAFGHLGINHSIHTQEIYINSVRMRAETNPDIKREEGSTWWRPCGTNILTKRIYIELVHQKQNFNELHLR